MKRLRYRLGCGGTDAPWEGAIFMGEGLSIVKYMEYRVCAVAMRPFVRLLSRFTTYFFIYLSVKMSYIIRTLAAQQGYKTLTVACLKT